MLEKIEINPKLPPKASVIWLHGLGADGYDFVDIVPQIALKDECPTRFIFPHAPLKPITFSQGEIMRAWFDLADLNASSANKDEKGIYASQKLVDELIDEEILRGMPSENIFLAGFSQGGAMALQSGLRYPKKLGGILVLSGFLLLSDKLAQEKNSSNQDTPILMLHGTLDHVVQLTWAKLSYDTLNNLKFKVQFLTYPMYHAVCAEEIRDIANWLNKLISKLDS